MYARSVLMVRTLPHLPNMWKKMKKKVWTYETITNYIFTEFNYNLNQPQTHDFFSKGANYCGVDCTCAVIIIDERVMSKIILKMQNLNILKL